MKEVKGEPPPPAPVDELDDVGLDDDELILAGLEEEKEVRVIALTVDELDVTGLEADELDMAGLEGAADDVDELDEAERDEADAGDVELEAEVIVRVEVWLCVVVKKTVLVDVEVDWLPDKAPATELLEEIGADPPAPDAPLELRVVMMPLVETDVTVSGQTVVESGMTEVTIEVEEAGQFVTDDGQPSTVTYCVEYAVEMDTAGNSSTTLIRVTADPSDSVMVLTGSSLPTEMSAAATYGEH